MSEANESQERSDELRTRSVLITRPQGANHAHEVCQSQERSDELHERSE